MAFETFRNRLPLFRIRVDLPRVYRVNDRRSVLYVSAEFRAWRFGALFAKDFYFPSLLAIKEMVHG